VRAKSWTIVCAVALVGGVIALWRALRLADFNFGDCGGNCPQVAAANEEVMARWLVVAAIAGALGMISIVGVIVSAYRALD
jgi:hypothetical protein